MAITRSLPLGGAWIDCKADPAGGRFVAAVLDAVGPGNLRLYSLDRAAGYTPRLQGTFAAPDGCRFLRLALSPGGVPLCVGQGQSGAFVYILGGKTYSVGIAFGQDSVAAQWVAAGYFRVLVLRSNVAYEAVRVNLDGSWVSLGIFPLSPTSQGFLDIDAAGNPIEVDASRSVHWADGRWLMLPDTAFQITVGQALADYEALWAHYDTDRPDACTFTIAKTAAFEPHIDYDRFTDTYAVSARPGNVWILNGPYVADPTPAPVQPPAPAPPATPPISTSPTPPVKDPVPEAVTIFSWDTAVVAGGSVDVRHWPETATISHVQFDPNGLTIAHSKQDAWPDITPPGWQGPIQFTLWIAECLSGVWHLLPVLEFWRGGKNGGDVTQLVTGKDGVVRDQIRANWCYWDGDMSQYPVPAGQQIGLFVTSGDQRMMNVGPVQERSNIVFVARPATVPQGFDFQATPVTPASPPPPSQPAPSEPAPSIDILALLNALDVRLTAVEQRPVLATLPDFSTFALKGGKVTIHEKVFGTDVALHGTIDA